jgi:predicted small metal-binding protein
LLLCGIRELNISRKEVSKMAYTLACRDAGVECPYVAQGETEEELLQDAAKHVKEEHGYTDEQLNDPKFLEEIKKIIKKT